MPYVGAVSTADTANCVDKIAQARLLVRDGVTLALVHILSLIAFIEPFGSEVLRLMPIPNFTESVTEEIPLPPATEPHNPYLCL